MFLDRRSFIHKLLVGAGLLAINPSQLIAGDICTLKHPFLPPDKNYTGTCNNCGMMRSMWARTWHTFTQKGKRMEVCSMHCLAEISMNSGVFPDTIEVALYHNPGQSVAAEQAFYVIGSKARGTMSMKSKIAFASKQEAEAYANSCGGKAGTFQQAYDASSAAIAEENRMITKKRISKGKIVEPEPGKDICPVCGMQVAKYQNNKCQIHTRKGEAIHFCATQCLFEFLHHPEKYQHPNVQLKALWVVDYGTGQWIYGKNAYYVVGSQVKGPMGKEAFPFVNKESAMEFSQQHAGKILRFSEVTISKILL